MSACTRDPKPTNLKGILNKRKLSKTEPVSHSGLLSRNLIEATKIGISALPKLAMNPRALVSKPIQDFCHQQDLTTATRHSSHLFDLRRSLRPAKTTLPPATLSKAHAKPWIRTGTSRCPSSQSLRKVLDKGMCCKTYRNSICNLGYIP